LREVDQSKDPPEKRKKRHRLASGIVAETLLNAGEELWLEKKTGLAIDLLL